MNHVCGPNCDEDNVEDDVKSVLLPDLTGPLAQLRQAIAEKDTDRWPVGTVIRWEADANLRVYIYAALKTPVGWATTAQFNNGWVGKLIDYDELVEILARSETQNAQVATAWENVG